MWCLLVIEDEGGSEGCDECGPDGHAELERGQPHQGGGRVELTSSGTLAGRTRTTRMIPPPSPLPLVLPTPSAFVRPLSQPAPSAGWWAE